MTASVTTSPIPASGAPSPAAGAESILLRDVSGGVATLTLNRPKQYNALSEEMLAALTAAFEDLATRDDLRAVVLAAEGKAFCAGHDLKQMRANPDRDYYQRLFESCSSMMLAILRLPVPVIAKVHGIATAAGCQLVGTCDMAIASEDAKFATSGINVALFCSTPAVALSRNVPRKPAFEMLMTGDFVDAATAAELGLINRAVPAAGLDAAVDALLEKLLAKSPVAIRTGKQMFYRQLEMGIEDAYRYAGEIMACNMMAEDTGEGIDAFIEKRKAIWRGR